MMAYDFTLARLAPRPVCWNLYPTEEAARADVERANASAARMGEPPYQPMPYAEFVTRKRAFYLAPENNPLTEITEDRWHEMLNVLPPLRWERAEAVERFLMAELLDGSITDQFARLGTRFFTRRACVRDRETWITGAEIAQHIAKESTHG